MASRIIRKVSSASTNQLQKFGILKSSPQICDVKFEQRKTDYMMLRQQELREQALRSHTIVRQQRTRASVLQQELKAIEQDLNTSIAHEQNTLESLAKAECVQLCTRVMTQLPRELRDMVYSHLIPESQTIDREYFRSTLDPTTRMHTYDEARWKESWHPEHWWHKEYAGHNFVRELLDQHYSTSTFVFGDDSGLIKRFLETDQVQVGRLPCELVSRIEVHLNALTFDRSSCIAYLFGTPTKPERLQAALEGTDMLKKGASVLVRFATRAKDEKQKEEHVLTACTSLIPKLAALKGNGYRVGLMVNQTEEIEIDGTGDYSLRQTGEVKDVAGE